MFVNVVFGADGREIVTIGNVFKINSCSGAPVVGFVSTSSITAKSLSRCCIENKH